MESSTQRRIVPILVQVLPAKRPVNDAQAQVAASAAISNDNEVNLMSLSNELLHIIALALRGSRTILDLSLTNKRLRAIAQDSMLRELCIPNKGIRQVLEMLGVNSSDVAKVRHLILPRQDDCTRTDCCCLRLSDLDTRTVRLLHDAIERNPTHDFTWERIQDVERDSHTWYHKYHSLLLDILVALLPSLKEVTMSLPPREDPAQTTPSVWPLTYQHASVSPFDGIVLQMMQTKLQVLTIQSDARYQQHIIKLPGFLNLRSLTISMVHLGSPSSIDFYKPDVTSMDLKKQNWLPLTLTDLHLTSCTRSTFVLLDMFTSFSSDLLRLKRITLAFDMIASSALILCAMEQLPRCTTMTALGWVQTLADLARKGLTVKLCAETSSPLCISGRRATFTEELQAMTTLSSVEVTRIIRAGMQLSVAVARSRTGSRRRSSPLERRLFLLHGTDYPTLFSSPTFSATYWTEVTFFHGTRKTFRRLNRRKQRI
ncbi:hypothetical protein C7974DRAFT_467935 [Boeremia exigua]|uniref:uncharacterized protein n=1 Tax=Boeremia exigua TaxID=749465 RepID=UPI001E8CB22E|nr:uncharacterized protein C7974DRAFT_467935 [Boeremia exigua]KAH6644275.1 hypothetical protein C7974DRAFT_467935 [Boeremia exigua]